MLLVMLYLSTRPFSPETENSLLSGLQNVVLVSVPTSIIVVSGTA